MYKFVSVRVCVFFLIISVLMNFCHSISYINNAKCERAQSSYAGLQWWNQNVDMYCTEHTISAVIGVQERQTTVSGWSNWKMVKHMLYGTKYTFHDTTHSHPAIDWASNWDFAVCSIRCVCAHLVFVCVCVSVSETGCKSK